MNIPRDISYKIAFEPIGIVATALPGETLLDCARRSGVALASACGGRGICKTCVVHIKEGQLPPPSTGDESLFSPDKIHKGWRRACQVTVADDYCVEIPARGRAVSARLRPTGTDIWVQPDPVVHGYRVTMPVSREARSDVERLMSAINERKSGAAREIDIEVSRQLAKGLSRGEASGLAVTRFGEIIAYLPAPSRLLGLAIDLGTTNIGVLLTDLRSGAPLGEIGIENPQTSYGADVITRMSHLVRDIAAGAEMRRMVAKAINSAVAELARKRRLCLDSIVDVVVAANTAMHHIFLGLPVDRLGRAPYVPAVTAPIDIKARELGIICAPGAYVHMLPNIAGFVGGDHAAMLLGIRADIEQRTILALDIGTNTEISLIHNNRITTLSCPSGPAFEGGNISCGMRAADGAIDAITVQDGAIAFSTIAGKKAIGLCGSSVLDAAAAFYDLGFIDARGRIVPTSSLFIMRDGQAALNISTGDPDIYFTQEDVRNIQLAKGAIRAGIEILLEKSKLTAGNLDKIVIAGAFGSYIRVESAIKVGMLPDLPKERFEQVGDAAGSGAKLSLLSQPMRVAAAMLATSSNYIELSGSDRFMRRFMTHIPFPTRSAR